MFNTITKFIISTLIVVFLVSNKGIAQSYPVEVKGIVTFNDGSQLEFDKLDSYYENFKVLDKSVITASKRYELPDESTISYLNIKSLHFGEPISKTKDFFYSGNSEGTKWQKTECAWVPVQIITQLGGEINGLYVTTVGDWGCGATTCTEELSFVKSGFVRTAKVATIKKVEFLDNTKTVPPKYPLEVKGIATFNDDSQFEFDKLNMYTKEFNVQDESVMTANKEDELPKNSTISYSNIKSLHFGELISKTKDFYYSGMPEGKKWQKTECTWVPVQITTQLGDVISGMYINTTDEWGCGSISSSGNLRFYKSGFTRNSKVSTIKLVDFQ